MDNTNDTEFYLKLQLLNLEGATPVIQSLFKKIADSTYEKNVDSFLNYFKEELEKSGVKDKLFQNDGETKDIKQWDVSLATNVLMNCCTLERNRAELKKILIKEINSNRDGKNLSNYLKTNKKEIALVKGHLITLEQYNKLKQATKVDDLDTELVVLILLICGSIRIKAYIKKLCETILLKEIEVDHNDNSKESKVSYINAKEETIISKKQNLAIFQTQFKELYPIVKQYDFSKWDTNLLVLFVINVCERITRKSQVALKRIRTIRNKMVAHTGKAEIKLNEFLSAWTKLYAEIKTLLTEENLDEDDFENRVKYLRDEKLDIQKAKDKIKEQLKLELSNEYEDLKDTIEAIGENIQEKMDEFNQDTTAIMKSINADMKNVGAVLKKFVDNRPLDVYNKQMDITCADIKIVVKGKDAKAVEKAHNAIAEAIKNPTDPNKTKSKAIDAILAAIERDGSSVIEVRKGSVIARVKFRNLKGVNSLLIFVDSEEWADTIDNLATDLGKEMGQTFTAEACIPQESLKQLHDDIEQKDKVLEKKSPLVFGKALDDDETNAKENIHVPELEVCKTFSVLMATDEHPCKVRACTVLDSGEIVVSDCVNNNIKLFDSNYTPCPEPMQLQNFPNDSCLSAQNQHEILITVPKTSSILIVRVENSTLQLTKNFDVEEECFGICCWPNEIATTVANPASKRWYVLLLNWHGIKIKTINVAMSSRVTPILVSLYSNDDGNTIIISDYGTSRVIAVDRTKGNVKYVCKDKHMYRVTNITAGDDSSMYAVGWLSDSVHVISPKGKVLGQVLSHKKDGLCCPSGMAYHQSTRTLVLQPDHSKSEMKVYQIELIGK